MAAGLVAYHNSFTGPLIFDDIDSITENPAIRSLWPIWKPLWSAPDKTVSGRPVLGLSLAINYAIDGPNVWSYHVANLAIHILSGMALFGIVRRTLVTDRLRERFAKSALPIALACAVLWVVHPLQTESVTYLIQRAESLMGLFYLLTLYCAIRAFGTRRGMWWHCAAVVSCVLGMGTKEVMATAPLMVLLYDRTFISASFTAAIRRRWRFYACLFGTWLVLAALVSTNPRATSAGFTLEPVEPIEYAMTQCQVILHYLRLSFWPNPLVLDYLWPVARSFRQVAVHAAALVVLLGGTAVLLWRKPAVGFLGAWFFIILGPTSSFMPIFDMAFEHRMYLSLAAVIVGVVIAIVIGSERLAARAKRALPLRQAGYALTVVVVSVLTLLTVLRNNTYRSAMSIWQDTIDKRPANSRAYNNRAVAHEKNGDYRSALQDYTRAITVNPTYAVAYNGRGVSYSQLGRFDLALQDYNKAIEMDPSDSKTYNNRGAALQAQGLYDEAIADFDKALSLNDQYDKAYNNRAIAYGKKGNHEQSIRDCNMAISLNKAYDKAYNNRGVSYGEMGLYDLAISDLTKAVELNPSYSSAYAARGLMHAKKSHFRKAIRDFDMALAIDPEDTAARQNKSLAKSRLREIMQSPDAQ